MRDPETVRPDEELREAVLRRVNSLPALHLEVSAHAGVITIAGYAPDHATRIAAEKAASDIEGVSAVVSRIQLEPMLRRQHYSVSSSDFRQHERKRIIESLTTIVRA